VSPVVRRWINEWDVVGTRRRSYWRRLTPPQLFVGSFATLVLVGTLGLRLLPGLYAGEPLGWLDALFMATSAVCVTGLIVVDTATFFTPSGQAFLLVLIQLGGLGMITFTTLIILALGRRLSLRQEAISARPVEVAPQVDFRRLARDVVRFTFLFEAVGALMLYVIWAPRLGAVDAVWPAVFHAVSAFCNAGFSVFSDSLMGFQQSSITLLVVMMMIVIGGLGFLTLEEVHLRHRARRSGRTYRMSLHSRLVLGTTAVLLLGGWVLFTVLEWRLGLEHLGLVDRLVNALFMSVTPRTAGFSTIDYAEASPSTNFLTIILMAIGGSPGSTAGGLKTTTIALIGLLAWSRFRGRPITTVWNRSVPEETTQRAVGLFVVGFGVITAAIVLFTLTEIGRLAHPAVGGSFLVHMFEATSAFNTVGLSMGATPELSTAGRVITIILMFVGRVGPLTFAAAIALAQPHPGRGSFRYAYEDVVVG
jgi:trk system potassium uptake protein